MTESEARRLRVPFDARITPFITKWPDGAEWMIGRTVQVVEIYKNQRTGLAPFTLCELDFGPSRGQQIISLPLMYLEPMSAVAAEQNRATRKSHRAAAKANRSISSVDCTLLDDVLEDLPT